MNWPRIPFRLPLVVASMLMFLLSSCVDIPDSGPAIPNYNSQFRFIYLVPSLPTLTVSMAPGPAFSQFTDLTPGNFGSLSTYQTFSAGAKKMLVKAGGNAVDADTATLSFGADQRGTVAVVPRRLRGPRPPDRG